ncbi:MAG: hypothetical protein M1536_07880 [Firmicutes bacterium]|nr:hypothetical protein [Bacillota bacterium]
MKQKSIKKILVCIALVIPFIIFFVTGCARSKVGEQFRDEVLKAWNELKPGESRTIVIENDKEADGYLICYGGGREDFIDEILIEGKFIRINRELAEKIAVSSDDPELMCFYLLKNGKIISEANISSEGIKLEKYPMLSKADKQIKLKLNKTRDDYLIISEI